MERNTEGFHHSNLRDMQYSEANKTFTSVGRTEWPSVTASYWGTGVRGLPVARHMPAALTNSRADSQACRWAFRPPHSLFIKKRELGIWGNANKSICYPSVSLMNTWMEMGVFSSDLWNTGIGSTFPLPITRDKLVLIIPQNTNATDQIVASPYKTKDEQPINELGWFVLSVR